MSKNNKLEQSHSNYQLEFLESVLNAISDPIFIKDKDHRWIYCNQAFCSFIGKSKEKIIGHSDYDFFSKEEADTFWEKDEEVFKSEQKNINIEPMTLPHGETKTLSTTKTIYTLSNKEKILVGIIRDITEQKKLEDDIEKTINYLNLALDGAGLGAWDWNVKTLEVFFDERCHRMLGLDPQKDRIDYKKWKEMVHPEDLPKVLEDIENYTSGKTQYYENTHRLKHTDGHWVYVLDKGSFSEWDDKGEPIRFNGTYLNITQKILEEQELKKQKAIALHNTKMASIGELASGIGHELNNPLNIIKMSLFPLRRLIKDDPSDNREETLKYYDKIDNSIERMANIILGLKNFSRNEIKPQKFSPLEATLEIYKLVYEIYEAEGIKLGFTNKITNQSLVIFGNRGKFQQTLLNLISNSKDATKDKKERKIEITLEQNQKQFLLEVKDNGKGIEDKLKEKVFEPFFTTKEINKGTGLGLSLAHTFVNELKGKIDIKSSIGQGTTITIQIPIHIC